MTVTTTPAPARTDRAARPESPAPTSPPRRRGSKPLAALTVAAPLLLGASITLHPDDTHGVEHTLHGIGGEAGLTWAVVHLVEPVAWMLLGVTLLLTLPRMAGARGGRLLTAAGCSARSASPPSR